MSALDVLKSAAFAAEGAIDRELPAGLLRFELEFPEAPDLGAARRHLAELAPGGGPTLDPLDPALPRFAVLQFPGVPRTISTPTLYGMAAELTRHLGLVSCAPDIGASFIVEPNIDSPITESVIGDAILNLTCWAEEDATLPPDWSIESIRADKAWSKTRGAGILVAQPDTGIARHPELDPAAFDLAKARNILAGTNDPTDPLPKGSGNPGHGTATSSIVVSREAGIIIGSAPEARLVPIRCVESVVSGIDGTPIARAVLHAVHIEADVISISLGGPFYSPSLGAAIEHAVASGAIVCAAAGNCVQPFVVYPASDPNVIAVAGIDRDDRPWKGTSRGPKVDVSAPAENVFVARRTPDDGGIGVVKPSQGTSFATALTAGVAALWLAHHGRDAVRAAAAAHGLSVHHLFRAALRATARRPASGAWDTGRFGAGIVDAEALLALALADVPAPAPVVAAVASDDADAVVNTVLTEAAGRRSDGFDWRRHGAEAVYLSTDAWFRASPTRSMLVESSRKPHPSEELAAAAPAILRTALAQAADAPAMRPPRVAEPLRRKIVTHLAARSIEGTESSARLSTEAAVAILENGGLHRLQHATETTFAKLDREATTIEGVTLRREVLGNVEPLVRTVIGEGPVRLDVAQRVGLEALVKLKDRPALRVVDGGVDPTDPLFGEWGGSLVGVPEMPALTGAVGRIDGDGDHIGTGFVVGRGLVMTNRHVLEAIAEEVRGPAGSRWVFSVDQATIDFSPAADGSRRFRILSVVEAGPDPIESLVRFPRLDMALLEVETKNGDAELPAAPPLIGDRPALANKGDMFTIGYPARPGSSAMLDPKTGEFSLEVAKRLGQIFNLKYGRKYVSPGRVEQPTVGVGDPRGWVFAHDATTLGGNSGSAVVRILDELGFCGLHFGGQTLTANYAHNLAAVKTSAVLTALSGAGVRWI